MGSICHRSNCPENGAIVAGAIIAGACYRSLVGALFAGGIFVGAIIAGEIVVGVNLAGPIVAGENFAGAFVADKLSRSNCRLQRSNCWMSNYRRSICRTSGDPTYAPTTFAPLKATIAPRQCSSTIAPAKFTPTTIAPAISAPAIIAPTINAPTTIPRRLLLLR